MQEELQRKCIWAMKSLLRRTPDEGGIRQCNKLIEAIRKDDNGMIDQLAWLRMFDLIKQRISSCININSEEDYALWCAWRREDKIPNTEEVD